MDRPTIRQLNMIAWLLNEQHFYDPTVRKLYESLPAHNQQYTDLRADYRIAILQDRLQKGATREQASYIIRCLNSQIDHSRQKLIQIFKQLKVTNS